MTLTIVALFRFYTSASFLSFRFTTMSDLLSPTLVWSELSSHQHRRDPIEFWKANLLFYNSIALTCNSMRFSCGCVSGCCPGSRDKFEHATILSDQLASLSTGLEAKSKLLEAKRGGSRRPEAWKNLAFY